MVQSIKRVVVYGDSFSAGDELLQPDFAEFIQAQCDAAGLKWLDTGKIEYPTSKSGQAKLNAIRQTVNNDLLQEHYGRCSHGHRVERTAEFQYTYGARLAERLGVPVVNYARGGNSALGIYTNVRNSLLDYDQSTLVLIGGTFVNRRSRLSTPVTIPDDSTQDQRILNHLHSYKNYLPNHKGGNGDEYTKYRQMDILYGDDAYFQYTSYLAQLRDLDNYLGDVPHIFVDVKGHYRRYKELQYLDDVQSHTKDAEIRDGLADIYRHPGLYDSHLAVKEAGGRYSACFGHFSRESHQHYADVLYDILQSGDIK